MGTPKTVPLCLQNLRMSRYKQGMESFRPRASADLPRNLRANYWQLYSDSVLPRALPRTFSSKVLPRRFRERNFWSSALSVQNWKRASASASESLLLRELPRAQWQPLFGSCLRPISDAISKFPLAHVFLAAHMCMRR